MPLDSGLNNAFTQIGTDIATINAKFPAKADLVGGKVPESQIPSISIIDFLGNVASQSAMLALAGQKGDWAIRTDTNTTWFITGTNPAQIGSWTELKNPTAPVSAVNGRTGSVVIDKTDVGLANVDNTSDANKPVSTAQAAALAGKEPTLAAGTNTQFFRGDKTFQPITPALVGLGNVTNNAQVVASGGVISFGAAALSARPAFGTNGRVFLATDTLATYYDNGSAWVLLEPALTGDVTTTAGSTVTTLATVNTNVGAFGTAGKVAAVTVDGKGRVTAVAEVTITPAAIGAPTAASVGNTETNFLSTYTTARGTI